ncbi:hypothetical protein GCM10028791_25930 [Echinicola sediminis]
MLDYSEAGLYPQFINYNFLSLINYYPYIITEKFPIENFLDEESVKINCFSYGNDDAPHSKQSTMDFLPVEAYRYERITTSK